MIKRFAVMLCLGIGGVAAAQEPVDLDMVNRIRHEAFHNSQVMETLGYLTETIGPRLSNSPQMARANAWTRSKFSEWGLANVHDDTIEDFGRGWEFSDAGVQMISPRVAPLLALPKAWTPATDGTVEGEVVAIKLKKVEDLEQYKGKLAGKIVLLVEARDYKRLEQPNSHRHDDASLDKIEPFAIPGDDDTPRAERVEKYSERIALAKASNEFFAAEGVLATLDISSRDNGIIRVAGGGSRKADESVGVPALTMIAEHYNELARAVENDQDVRLRINVQARFTDDSDQPAYNTVAEIPGSGRKANEVVMIGAHLDSWHAGTGAADNGAGVAVMMEAMRILKALDAKPARTIRVALWSGEEQGLIGSQAYVAKHFAAWPEPTDEEQKALPASLREPTGPLQKKQDYERLTAYFNMDNGSGRFRGIYAQENVAVMPIFAAWLKPFHDVGANTVVSRNTGSTDHISFDRVGLPGFQFIQDRLDYFSNVHHTNLDTLDHIEPEDLKQAAAIMASFAWHAATRDELLPRKPVVEPK